MPPVGIAYMCDLPDEWLQLARQSARHARLTRNLEHNQGLLYSETGEPEEAKPLFARAYLIYDRIGAPAAGKAFSKLASLCGSEEAARAYLATFTEAQADEV